MMSRTKRYRNTNTGRTNSISIVVPTRNSFKRWPWPRPRVVLRSKRRSHRGGEDQKERKGRVR
ncbi:hypothetical protein MARPO_0060s0039 [Marchantia polymorpha]|uniref:Uncharacterized protein n=1 Tax=Marchantia polymorpha TaxID=3197 RepID=A0A2R6WSX3_MARPO|nr:hypothetical protein MARPO_0060s0039 [Marchantia polymorpha]|eukprot:PTQ36950.1 hypothetical protein MARPO_0060s0039 [Marchantia polymorpha]